MRILFLFFLLFNALFLSAKEEIPSPKEKLIFLKDQLLPENLYINQILPIRIDTIIAEDIFDSIETVFGKNYGIEILTNDPVWYLQEQNSFTLTYYIKIKESYIKIPDLTTSVTRNGLALDTSVIDGSKLKALKIQPNDQFCNVLAKNLVIKNHKVDKYDEISNIIVAYYKEPMETIQKIRDEMGWAIEASLTEGGVSGLGA